MKVGEIIRKSLLPDKVKQGVEAVESLVSDLTEDPLEKFYENIPDSFKEKQVFPPINGDQGGKDGLIRLLCHDPDKPLGKLSNILRESGWKAPVEDLSENSGIPLEKIRRELGKYGALFREDNDIIRCTPLVPQTPIQ